MGLDDLQVPYNPANLLDEEEIQVVQPEDLLNIQQANLPNYHQLQQMIALQAGGHPGAVVQHVTRADRWAALRSILEYARLREVLQRRFGTEHPHNNGLN
jgi:hypothetical protein